ncbi:hypothetical protein BD311DRAFT_759274, partial [Dichomitus squalens]
PVRDRSQTSRQRRARPSKYAFAFLVAHARIPEPLAPIWKPASRTLASSSLSVILTVVYLDVFPSASQSTASADASSYRCRTREPMPASRSHAYLCLYRRGYRATGTFERVPAPPMSLSLTLRVAGDLTREVCVALAISFVLPDWPAARRCLASNTSATQAAISLHPELAADSVDDEVCWSPVGTFS